MAYSNLNNDAFFLELVRVKLLRVTRNGRAFNLKTKREVATSKSGYRKISWQDPVSKKIVQIQLHRLIWNVFKGPILNANLVVNHKDGDKTNCHIKNLELTDDAGNCKHAYSLGLVYVPRGGNRSNACFTDRQAMKHRRAWALSGKSEAAYAKLNCGEAHWVTLYGILKNKTYTHIK